MSISLESWRALADSGPDPALLAVPTRPTVADLAALRKRWPAGVVAAAVEATRARDKACRKLIPDVAERILADAAGVEVASSAEAAAHKARLLAPHATRGGVLDLCCGIGGDAIALAAEGARVLAVDADPVRAWMAGRNAGCETAVGDVTTNKWLGRVEGGVVHLDPSRRDVLGRRHRYTDYQPGPEAIAAIVRRATAACVKLGPGVDFDELPGSPPHSQQGGPAATIEMLSERGRLTQALLWTGEAARSDQGRRIATMLPAGESFVAEPAPLADPFDEPPDEPIEAFLFEPDPSLERMDLLGPFARTVGLRAIHPAVGLLTGPEVVASPWLTPFRVLEMLPWRPRRVRAALRSLGGGVVSVKTRGVRLDTDDLQRTLRGDGDWALEVFVLRLGDARVAAIAERGGPG
ncbi:MAG: class I SAM-dependent methyltransferase [Planctomycetota bacterium]